MRPFGARAGTRRVGRADGQLRNTTARPAQEQAGASLTYVEGERWRTSSGLHLTEQAVRRLLSHSQDRDANHPHGVFDNGRRGAIDLADAAYRRALQGGADVSARTTQAGKTIYDVDMGRPIGFIGGAVRGRPAARHVRVIVQGAELIEAYPFRPMNRTQPVRDEYAAVGGAAEAANV
ncbi:hypothetical protein KDK88_05055, partial [bacterium]|nr:hypothetical protein [bacterium]